MGLGAERLAVDGGAVVGLAGVPGLGVDRTPVGLGRSAMGVARGVLDALELGPALPAPAEPGARAGQARAQKSAGAAGGT